jgi:hypothetical protein
MLSDGLRTEWGGNRRQGRVGGAPVAAVVVQGREGGGETLARYHARRNELYSVLKGPRPKTYKCTLLQKGQIRRRLIHIANNNRQRK